MGTGIVKGLKKVGRTVRGAGKAVGKGATSAVKAVSPPRVAANAVERMVDTLKNDQLVIEIFGVKVGRLYVADKE